ncbi:SET domain-containing protein [Paraburkholderia sp. Clong3]
MIDGSRDGNSARFLNHACAPNCEAVETGDRVFIHALSPIAPGDELFINYGLAVDGSITDEIRAQYSCHCGAAGCRRTMLGSFIEAP